RGAGLVVAQGDVLPLHVQHAVDVDYAEVAQDAGDVRAGDADGNGVPLDQEEELVGVAAVDDQALFRHMRSPGELEPGAAGCGGGLIGRVDLGEMDDSLTEGRPGVKRGGQKFGPAPSRPELGLARPVPTLVHSAPPARAPAGAVASCGSTRRRLARRG